MKPIPVQFHIGPLLLHTYGIGLAVTFWVAYRYYEHRLKVRGYPVEWLPAVFGWVVVTAIAGARILHVAANWSYYSAAPGQILAVWHGGLSSFGGLLFAVPTGTYLAARRCPNLSAIEALDIVAPVLVLAWAIGRLLGPQLMVAGGGRETTAWYGMAYAGQVGKRIPVPLIQAADCLVIYAIVLLVEHYYTHRPRGFLIATAATLYGLARFFEENVFLRQNDHTGSVLVQAAGLGLVVLGASWMLVLSRRGVPVSAPAPLPEALPDAADLVRVLPRGAEAEAGEAEDAPEPEAEPLPEAEPPAPESEGVTSGEAEPLPEAEPPAPELEGSAPEVAGEELVAPETPEAQVPGEGVGEGVGE
jgi:phosphatidylglycerol:prolipoprotein diacylglycerol transferase